MKNLSFKTLIFALSPLMVFCQSIPQFQTTIYVEDAIGNIDSVIIGFDTLATTGIDNLFGEFEMQISFDSVLDVRAGTFLGFERDKLSKIVIEPSEPVYPISTSQGCYAGLPVFIYIWAKYQPVHISWNKEQLLENVCVRGSLVSNHWADELTDPYDWNFWPQNEYHCMADDSTWVIDISADAIQANEVNTPVVIQKEVEGIGIQNIYGIRFFPSPTFTAWTPCYYITKSNEITETISSTISLYPNPVRNRLVISSSDSVEFVEVKIYDFQGELLYQFSKQSEYDVSNLSTGMYLLQVEDTYGNIHVGKIIKM